MIERSSALEQVLQRYGDNLYRLALLLCSDTAGAEAALLRATQPLTSLPLDQPEAVFFQALVSSLPPERRPGRRLPLWAEAPDPRASEARILAALARLPRSQRLAVALALIGSADSALEPQQRSARRDALLALAPAAGLPDLPAALEPPELPEACRAARTALVLDDPMLHLDPALRGHLALCDECRALAQRWQRLAELVEETLRGALRPLRMPEGLARRMREAALPAERPALVRTLAGPGIRRALLPLGIIALIAALIWPRSAPESVPSPPAQTGAAPGDLRGMVASASANLYAAPGDGVWQQRYFMRWSFPDGSYAPLAGTLWTDSQGGRSRIQLTHEAGGGPYEFLLSDGRERLWYATTRSYGESNYPLIFDARRLRVTLALGPAEQQRAVAARLNSGAWALPEAYLAQAEGATLQSWGQQRDTDGTLLEVVGFRGFSALASPPDSPGASSEEVTILLSISVPGARLHEVRELLGPPGGDQVSRSVWRALEAKPVEDTREADRAFNLSTAWNGTGAFDADPTESGRPELPFLNPDDLASPALALEFPSAVPVDFLAKAPAATEIAALLPTGTQRNNAYALVYAGPDRTLSILGMADTVANRANFSTEGGVEQLTLSERPTLLRRLTATTYAAQLRPPDDSPGRGLLEVYASGYTREELLLTLADLRPLTPQILQSQMSLFASGAEDRAAYDAVMAALLAEPALEPGQVRHTVARVFTRQRPDLDQLADPYHYPAYGGRPEVLNVETWTRVLGDASGAPVVALSSAADAQTQLTLVAQASETFTRVSDADGRVFEQRYEGPAGAWIYGSAEQLIQRFGREQLPLPNAMPRSILLRMLACGATQAEMPEGRMFIYTERRWTDMACVRPFYPVALRSQQNPRWTNASRALPDTAPYISNMSRQQITTFVYLGADGRVRRIETRAGTAPNGPRLETWELVSDQILTGDEIPAELAGVPAAPFLYDYTNTSAIQPAVVFRPVTITDALQLARTPLLAPADEALGSWYAATTVAADLPADDPVDWPFDDALWRGLAVQLELQLIDPATGAPLRVAPLYIYQGEAEGLRSMLRSRAIWRDSQPDTLEIAGQTVDAWRVETARGEWVLAELQGTLIAFQDTGPEARAAIAAAQIIRPE